MKTLVVLVFGLVFLELGSALKCYKCEKESCDLTQVCTNEEDSCLSVSSGDIKFKQCLKFADCEMLKLATMFPGLSLKYSCCTSNLCNAASLSVASNSVLGLLLSIALFWWGVL